jgi:hypothetical protein
MLGWPDDEDEIENYDGNQADLIPGDNDLPEPPSTIPIPPIPNAPDNLNHIPADPNGVVPIAVEPIKPLTPD